MFTLQSFTIFFWSLASIIVLMLIFEDKLLMLEAKYDERKDQKKRTKNKSSKKSNVKNVKTIQRNTVKANGNQRPQSRYAA